MVSDIPKHDKSSKTKSLDASPVEACTNDHAGNKISYHSKLFTGWIHFVISSVCTALIVHASIA